LKGKNEFTTKIMFPPEFIKRIESQRYIDSEGLLKALSEPSPVSIRINPGKWNKIPLDSERVPWCATGYYLKSRPSFTLDPLFHSGCYYPREASGMFLEQVFKQITIPESGIRVLDLCGAPGGKSIQISDLIGPSNLLIANEVIRSRAVVLAETITKCGSGNTIVTQNDPAAYGRLKGYFDVVLIDAPCSGEGMFRTKVAVDEWSVENTNLCTERQKRIVSDIWPSLKEGGLLIYSTCTFNPSENEENISWLTGKKEAESVVLDIAQFNDITEIDFEGIKGYGFYPGLIKGEGFFISVVRKNNEQETETVHRQKKTDLLPARNEREVAGKWIDLPEDRLLKWGDELYSIPCAMEEYIFLFNHLNVVKGGTRIFTVKKNDYLPSHDLALSQYLKPEAFPRIDISLQEAIAYLRRDNITSSVVNDGWNILTYNDVSIGLIKNLGKRVNNYFPVEWRIKMDKPVKGTEIIISWD
jgi:16S rRNA C967 or C1407 C5-methylase (RsmB/RsmF family)/NOL1/NOP2/fmu family ribosome biogenesis protein